MRTLVIQPVLCILGWNKKALWSATKNYGPTKVNLITPGMTFYTSNCYIWTSVIILSSFIFSGYRRMRHIMVRCVCVSNHLSTWQCPSHYHFGFTLLCYRQNSHLHPTEASKKWSIIYEYHPLESWSNQLKLWLLIRIYRVICSQNLESAWLYTGS